MYQVDQGAYWQAQRCTGSQILIAILILVATWLVARAVKWALQKAIDRSPTLKRHVTGTPNETVGHQLGTIAKLIIWLVGIMAALQFLGIGQILGADQRAGDRNLRVPAAADRRRADLLRRPDRRADRPRLVETVLIAANVDGLLAADRDRRDRRHRRTDPSAVPPARRRARPGRASPRAAGVLVFALIIIPVAIAALQVLGIEAISGPAIGMLNEILAAIPRVLAAALWIGIAFIAARFLKTIIEAVLPPTGFDEAIRSTGVVPAAPARRGSSPTSR